ncbi:MAG TPA: hypothetical protein VLB44_00325 [Kofleriaceae bacterium]|nr:hypothetical protein [Kofleriaceae bacterium]
MRTILLAFALFTASACAHNGPRPVNVAAARSEISGTIRSQSNDRTIHSMGHVDATRAVVYTTNSQTGAKQEETWIKDGQRWKLQTATAIAGTPQTNAN